MMSAAGGLSAERQRLREELRELEAAALQGRDRKAAVDEAGGRREEKGLPPLRETTVGGWFEKGTPAKDFEDLWALVEVLLEWSGHPRPEDLSGADRLKALAWWKSTREVWRTRYRQARDSRPPSRARTGPHGFDAARQAYCAALRRWYARVDVLAPGKGPVGRPRLRLSDVFVAPSVRTDPSAGALPYDLMRRPVAAGGTGRALRVPAEESAQRVLRALAEESAQRIVLLGNPGAGKSTLARYLALALAEAMDAGPDAGPDVGIDPDLAPLTGSLPLLVELRAYADPRWRTRTLLDLVARLHDTTGRGLPRDLLEAYLRAGGRAVVIFDGLDELLDPRLREEVSGEIAGFAWRYPGVRVVVTSRVIEYQRAVFEREDFRTCVLQDFDRARIDAFVTGWYRLAFPADPAGAARLRDRLLAAIDGSPAAGELAGNPMMLTMLALRGEHQDLPRDRRGVYEHAVSAFIAQWDPSRYSNDERVAEDAARLRECDRLELLRRVAHRLQDGQVPTGGTFLHERELVAELDGFLRERYPPDRAMALARAMLDEFRARNSVLSHFGERMYGFPHRALLEYLAAAEIHHRLTVEHSLTWDALVHQEYGEHWADPARHETLVLVAGMVEPRLAGRIVDHLLAADPLWFVGRPGSSSDGTPHHIVLAARCLGEVRDPGELPDQCSAVVNAVIALIEHMTAERASPGSPVTRVVVETLPPVLGRLGARDSAVRRRYHDWYLARGQFLSVMREGENFAWSEVPPAARIGAALLRDDSGFRESLVAQAVFGPAPAGREEALRALVQEWPDDPQVAGLVRELAETDPDGNVRRGSVQLSAMIGRPDRSTRDWLRTCLTDDDRYLRQGALAALTDGWRDEPETFAEVRRCASGDRDRWVRLTAVRCVAAGWPGDPDAAAVVRERAARDPDPDLRTSVFGVLVEGWPEDPQTVELLRAVAADPGGETWVREAARRALGRAGTRAVGPGGAPRTTLPPPEEDPRHAALEPLVVDRRTEAKTPVLLRERAETHPDDRVRVAAVRALAAGWHTDRRTLSWLCELAASGAGEPVRQAALWAVCSGWPGRPDAGALLRGVAGGEGDSRTRAVAVVALAAGWRDDPETWSLLRGLAVAVADDAEFVRATTVRTLGAGPRDHPDTVALLHDRAENDPEPYVRGAAVQSLVTNFRTPRTAVLLRRLAVEDPDEHLRADAVHHLAAGWRTDPETGALLRRIVTGRTDTVSCRAAIRALAGGWRDDPVTEALLRERAADDSDWVLQEAAVEALSERWPHDPGIQALADRFSEEW